MIRAFVFDMDGLLVETESLHIRSFNEFLRVRGVEPPEGYAEGLVGFSVLDNVLKMKRDFGFAEGAGELAGQRGAIYLRLVAQSEIHALPGAAELFEFALEHGLRKAVCSSSERAQLDAILPRLLESVGMSREVTAFFDAVVCGGDVERLKPAPDLYVECARRLDVPARHCLAFEDSLVGAQSAAAAGMPVAVVPNPYARRDTNWPTQFVASSLEEILKERMVVRDEEGRVRLNEARKSWKSALSAPKAGSGGHGEP